MTTNYVADLQAWAEREKVKGLVDIKFFPSIPSDPPMDLQTAAKGILELLSKGTDIGDESL